MSSSIDAPPSYLRTVYDETHRGVWYMEPSIDSMGNRPNLLAYLDHHTPDTDGSFAICIAGGNGNFISQELLDSIPSEHRPVLNTDHAGTSISCLVGGPMKSVGSVLVPFILTNAETNERIRLVLYALVVPKLLMGMFIGRGSASFIEREEWSGGATFFCDFGNEKCKIQGM